MISDRLYLLGLTGVIKLFKQQDEDVSVLKEVEDILLDDLGAVPDL